MTRPVLGVGAVCVVALVLVGSCVPARARVVPYENVPVSAPATTGPHPVPPVLVAP